MCSGIFSSIGDENFGHADKGFFMVNKSQTKAFYRYSNAATNQGQALHLTLRLPVSACFSARLGQDDCRLRVFYAETGGYNPACATGHIPFVDSPEMALQPQFFDQSWRAFASPT
jgi:hypothetical protein